MCVSTDKSLVRKSALLSATLSLALLSSACDDSESGSDSELVNQEPGLVLPSSCFWVGPYNKDNPEMNFAFPDTGAAYWHAGYTIPQGATLKLHGQFPHARYISFNSYDQEGVPLSALKDKDIVPDSGASNPYLTGADRTATERSYTLTLSQEPEASNPEQNTLYGSGYQQNKSVIIYRVYVPDSGLTEQGGVELPSVELNMSDGRNLYGEAACAELEVDERKLRNIYIPAATYQLTRMSHDPADYPTKWTAPYNVPFTIRCGFKNQCDGNPERKVAFFANLDNHYVAAFLNRQFGEVMVTRGKLPKVPKTQSGETTFDDSDAQLRYWSICQNEFYSQKVTDCIYDENIQLDDEGYYTVVTSKDGDRPVNATEGCGVGFLPWPKDGDGYGTTVGTEIVNSYDDAILLVRNMTPADDFAEAVQNTQTPGDEYSVMGEYLPVTEYMSKAEFEALGCLSQN